MRVDIYSDVACPWCAIGKKRFERALTGYDGADQIEVTYHPFQLDPEASPAGEPEIAHVTQKFGPNATAMLERVGRIATSEGFPINWEKVIATNTLDAHRLLWLGLNEGSPAIQRDLVGRLFAAFFQEGANVADPAVLTELGVAAGLDRDRVTAFLASDEAAADVRHAIAMAQAQGIHSVPTYIFEGKWAVEGAQEASTFLDVFAQVAAETGEASSAQTTDEACADDSCVIPARS